MANSVIKHIQVGPSGTTYDIVNQKVKVGATTFDDNAVVSITGSNGVSVVGATGTNPTITVKGPSNYVIGGSQTTTSSADGGSNVFTFNKSDGTSATFTVKNGSKGSTGAVGPTGPTGPAPDLTKYPTLAGTNTFTSKNYFDNKIYLGTPENNVAELSFKDGTTDNPTPEKAYIRTVIQAGAEYNGRPTIDFVNTEGGSHRDMIALTKWDKPNEHYYRTALENAVSSDPGSTSRHSAAIAHYELGSDGIPKNNYRATFPLKSGTVAFTSDIDVTAAGNNTLSGTNTFTGSNWFKGNGAIITTQNGIRIGFSNGVSPDTDSGIYSIDKYGFYGLGENGSLQTIKFPDLSTFSTATHTIPLSDTNNTFTGTNLFKGGTTQFLTSSAGLNDPKTDVGASGMLCQTGGNVGTYYKDGKITNGTNTLTLPLKSGTVALTDDCITIIERTGITLPTKTASTTIALTDEEKALIVKDPSKVMFKINLSNVFYYSGAHGPTYRYDPVYPRSGNSYYIQVDQQTGSPCIMFITLQGVVTSNPALSGSESTLTSISINGTSYKIGDVTAAGNNTFTGTNTFKTETSDNLYRTLINLDGVSVGTGPRSSIAADTTYGYNDIKRLNTSNSYTYTFPSKSGVFALTSDIDVKAAGNNTFTGSNKFYGSVNIRESTASEGNFVEITGTGYIRAFNNEDNSVSGGKGNNLILHLPLNKEGNYTIATTDDIPDTSNFVTLSGAQTISGNKTFNNHIILPNGPDGYIEFGNWRFFGYSLYNSVTGTSLSFSSDKNGTIATTSDIPIKTATLSGTTLSITLS